MKAGWALTSIGNVCTVIAGQSPEGQFYNDQSVGLPFFQGKKDFQEKHIGEARVWTSKSTKEAQAGDILMSVRAPVGPINFATQHCCIGRGLAAIRAGKECDADYLYYVLLSKESEISGNEGAVFASINKSEIQKIEIPLPPLEEQRRIVAVLDKAFAGIATATANAQQNLTNTRALFDSALERELGNYETSAPSTTIGSEVDFCFGFAFKSNRYTSDLSGVRLLRGDNIINGSLRWDGVVRWPAAERDEYRTFELQSGDVVLAMDRTWVKSGLKFAVIDENDLPLLLVQRVARMRCRAPLLNRFLAYQIESPAFTRYIIGIQTGLGVPHISGKQIGAFNFIMPSLDEQKQIVMRLDALKALQHTLEAGYQKKLIALSELKQSLLQKAFAGELT